MGDAEEERRQSLWRFSPNMNNIQERVRDQRLQHQFGQVVRGVIPGAGAQPEYHPNPYLQHLYNRQGQGTDDAGVVRGDDRALNDLEAQLQEVLVAADRQEDGGALGDSEHAHTHAHTHSHEQPRPVPIDWKILMSSVTFGLILFLRLMADHILGLLVFVGLSAVFYRFNNKMIEVVHITSLRDRQSGRQVLLRCLWLIAFLSANVVCIYMFFSDEQLWRVLYYTLPTTWQGSVFDLFWVTMVTDNLVRFATIIVKSIIALTPTCFLPQKRKGKHYMLIETVIQLYRTTLPVVPWLHFLYDQPSSGKLIFAAILTIIYVILKIWSFLLDLLKLKKAFTVFKTDTKYGVQPSQDELNSREENCPICQDDYQDPVMLSCKHIFCENCVSIWFDREKTCPMCRAQIQSDSPVWQDGSTSGHLQWY